MWRSPSHPQRRGWLHSRDCEGDESHESSTWLLTYVYSLNSGEVRLWPTRPFFVGPISLRNRRYDRAWSHLLFVLPHMYHWIAGACSTLVQRFEVDHAAGANRPIRPSSEPWLATAAV